MNHEKNVRHPCLAQFVTALVSQGIVDPGASVKPDGSVDFRSKQPLLRQEAAVLLDKAFGYYTLPLKVQ